MPLSDFGTFQRILSLSYIVASDGINIAIKKHIEHGNWDGHDLNSKNFHISNDKQEVPRFVFLVVIKSTRRIKCF